MFDIEELPEYKPLSPRSKFIKPNRQGQIPCECVFFSFTGKHCQKAVSKDFIYQQDCNVLKGESCDTFKQTGRYFKN